MIFVQKIVRSNSMVGELKLSKIENFNDNRMPLVMDIYKEAFPNSRKTVIRDHL